MKRVAGLLAAATLSALANAQTLHAGKTITNTSPTPTISTTEVNITHKEERASFDGPAEHFTGKVHVEMLLSEQTPARASGGSVTFLPGARTAWHTHPLGQTLIVTSGVGRVQYWGGAVREMRPGDVVWIPPNVKHWHGAAPKTSMTHIAIAEQLDGNGVTWLEQVSAQQYDEGSAAADTASATANQPSAAQKLLGDITPGLAQLTDEVLFGDVWRRPGLSKRDRSLATVSALIALNRPDQLRSHLALAKQNGVTQEELLEAITHLAFYAGWPSAVTAAGVARDVFANH